MHSTVQSVNAHMHNTAQATFALKAPFSCLFRLSCSIVGCICVFDNEELQGKVIFTTDATTVVAPTSFEAVSDYDLRRGGASGVADGPWHKGVSSLSVQLRRSVRTVTQFLDRQ